MVNYVGRLAPEIPGGPNALREEPALIEECLSGFSSFTHAGFFKASDDFHISS
jgi:hypothetical protein